MDLRYRCRIDEGMVGRSWGRTSFGSRRSSKSSSDESGLKLWRYESPVPGIEAVPRRPVGPTLTVKGDVPILELSPRLDKFSRKPGIIVNDCRKTPAHLYACPLKKFRSHRSFTKFFSRKCHESARLLRPTLAPFDGQETVSGPFAAVRVVVVSHLDRATIEFCKCIRSFWD